MSETNFLKLKKHDNPSTNEEQFDIENYLNGNWDKIDENVGEVNTNISNINSKNTELEKELKEIQEDFYQNSIRGQASGEYIHVEDSSNCRAKIGIGGNSEQETSTQTENYVDDRKARGKTISQATSLYLPIINLKAGDNYYFKIFDKDNQLLQNSMYLAVEFYDANKTKIQDGPLGFPKSFTEEAVTKIKYAKIYYNGNDTDKAIGNAVIKKIGLKITSNASADDIDLFVPNMPSTDYLSEIKTVGSNGSVKVTKCNENILDTSITKNVKNQNGEERIGYFCRITKTGTYYLMLNTANTLYFGKSTDLNSATTLIGSTSSTFSTTYDFNEGEYFVLWGTKTEKDKIMVILSNKQQKYIEHQEQSYIMPIQQPMRSIGDIRDIFIKKNNKWYERHYIARRIFNGIANKFNAKHRSIYTDTRGLYQLNLPGKILGTNGSVAYGKSNYLKYKNGNAMDAIYQDCLWWENTSNYNYASIPFLSLTEANEWLVKLNDNGNPFYIDYVLAEPLDIECTEEQSQILEELNNARTYKNVTNITTDSKAILSLDYAKDQETQNQKMQNEIDEIKQLLSTTQTSAMLLDNLQKEVESEVE